MNTEELIDRLLDGTLSDTELRQLESQMIANEGVSNEVRELLHLEEAMNKSANVHFEASEAYRQDVADRVKEKMRAETGVVLTSGRLGSFVSGVSSTLRGRVAIGAGALLLTALIVPFEFGTDPVGEPLADVVQPSAVVVENQLATEPPPVGIEAATMIGGADENYVEQLHSAKTKSGDELTEADASRTEELPTAAAEANEQVSEPDVVERIQNQSAELRTANIVEPRELTPEENLSEQIRVTTKVASEQGNPHAAEAARLYDSLRDRQANGDMLGAAQVQKQLGVLYRGTGEFSKSEEYLHQVLNTAREQGIGDLEAAALGELGLLDSRQGRINSARERLQACVAMKRSMGSFDLQRWEHELTQLDK